MIWAFLLGLAILGQVFWFNSPSDLWILLVLIGWVVLLRRQPSQIKAQLWITAALSGLSLVLFWVGLNENSIRAANWVFWLWLITIGWLIDREWHKS